MRLSRTSGTRLLRVTVAPLAAGTLIVACSGGAPRHGAAGLLATDRAPRSSDTGSPAGTAPGPATTSVTPSPSTGRPSPAATRPPHAQEPATRSLARRTPVPRSVRSAPPTRSVTPTPTSAPRPKPVAARAPATGMSTDEAQVLQLVNRERASAGCRALTSNSTLLAVARAHSKDMAVNGYFGHDSLDGRTPFDRMRAAGYSGNLMGENIAAGQTTPAAVMAAWMHSSGHRANIVNCGYRVIGIGVYRLAGSPYRIYWTQDFGDR